MKMMGQMSSNSTKHTARPRCNLVIFSKNPCKRYPIARPYAVRPNTDLYPGTLQSCMHHVILHCVIMATAAFNVNAVFRSRYELSTSKLYKSRPFSSPFHINKNITSLCGDMGDINGSMASNMKIMLARLLSHNVYIDVASENGIIQLRLVDDCNELFCAMNGTWYTGNVY